MREHDELFRDTVARHFPDVQIDGDELELGFASVRLRCWVDQIGELGELASAALFFHVRGGMLGDAPTFMSVSGYGETAEAAIITGACNWACAFGPVFRAALAGEDLPDVDRFEVTADGQRFRVFVATLDRSASFDGADATDRIAAARARFAPRSWLASSVIDSGRLPALDPDRATVLSAFVSDMPGHRMVEVKLSGGDWPGMDPNLPCSESGA